MKYILTIILALVASVGISQEASFYKLTQVSAYDVASGSWSDFVTIDGIMGTQGNIVRLQVPEYDFTAQFNLSVVDKEENSEAFLVKYLDVQQQAVIWFYHEKLTKRSLVRVTVNGEGLQFVVGKPIRYGD